MRSASSVVRPVIAAAFLSVGFLASVSAQDQGLKDDLRKMIDGGAREVSQELGKLIQSQGDRFVEAVLKAVEARTGERLAKLETEIKARDKKIADLEARVKELAQAAPKPAPQPAPQPAPASSNTFLGVGHADVPADLRAKLKIEGGALVTQVLDESPAAGAGLAVNDVIVEVQGTPVSSANLSSVVGGLKPDQEVNVTYFHDGNRVTKPAKLADREKFFAARAAKAAPAPAKKEPVVLGVTVLEKDGALHVDAVEDGFTGGVAGLKAGDKITHLNGKELKTLEDIAGELKKVVEGDKLVIVHKRGDETITVNVVGAHGKEGAKVVARESKKPQPKEEPKPAEPKPAEKKPGLLGVAVVPDAAGVVVDSVLGDTAAAAAGVQKGDVIRKANGHEIADVDALKGILSKLSAGDKVSLEVSRDGKPVELKDIVLKAEGDKVAAAKPPEKAPEKKPEEAPKPPKAKQKGALGILATQTVDQKVVVRSVNPGGAAEKADLKPGDVFLKINDKAVAGFGDLESVLQVLFAGDSVTIRVLRGTEEKDIKVTLGEA